MLPETLDCPYSWPIRVTLPRLRCGCVMARWRVTAAEAFTPLTSDYFIFSGIIRSTHKLLHIPFCRFTHMRVEVDSSHIPIATTSHTNGAIRIALCLLHSTGEWGRYAQHLERNFEHSAGLWSDRKKLYRALDPI